MNGITVSDLGLVCGLVEMPDESVSAKELFNDSIFPIFKKYKDGVSTYGSGSPIQDDLLYSPVAYKLFGDYDLLCISLIEDFAFPNTILHPKYNNGMLKGYNMQVTSGIVTQDVTTLTEQAQDTFLHKKEDNPFPYVAFVTYKINNGCIGRGIETLDLIKKQLKKATPNSIRCICMHSFSDYEIAALYFGNSLSDICKLIVKTRALKLSSITNSVNDLVVKKSLLYEALGDKDKVLNSHLFGATFSHFGIRMDIDIDSLPSEIISADFLWNLKPGHCGNFKEIVDKSSSAQSIAADSLPIDVKILTGHSTMEAVIHADIKPIMHFEEEVGAKGKSHMRRQRVYLTFDYTSVNGLIDEGSHPKLMEKLSACLFKGEVIDELNKNLRACRISKQQRERVLRMFFAFNKGTADLFSFSYFIEIRGYLESIIDTVKANKGHAREKNLHLWLDKFIRVFEEAYRNRSQQDSIPHSLSEFNLEYNGSLQQLLTAYDVPYRIIAAELEKQAAARKKLIYLSGYEGVTSDYFSLKINVLHVTYPELYASTIWKECFNHSYKTLDLPGAKKKKWLALLLGDARFNSLIRGISGHEKFDPTLFSHGKLLVFARTNELLEYFVADAFVFITGYGSDFSTYSFWLWAYFLQLSYVYTSDREIDPEEFIYFYARWIFVNKLSKNERRPPFSTQTGELSNRFCQEVSLFVDIVWDELTKESLFAQLGAMAQRVLQKDMGIYEGMSHEEQEEALRVYTYKKNEREVEFQSSFNKGEVITYDENKDSKLSFVRDLTQVYLKSVMALNSDEEGKTLHVLERDEEGDIEKREAYHSILIDPSGGMFIWNRDKRRDYFRLRSVFYQSLWDLGCREKREYIVELLQEASPG
ncbi:MAG: hypothetical protein LBN29_04890 [Mediterranea sp.]|nr:hypothetical protein [Mediterranea sp.]